MRVSCRLHFGSGPCGGFSTLQPLGVLDPVDGGAVLAVDLALDDRRHHVHVEHAIELVGGDLGLVALHEALAVAGPERLPRETRDGAAGFERGALRLGDADRHVLHLRRSCRRSCSCSISVSWPVQIDRALAGSGAGMATCPDSVAADEQKGEHAEESGGSSHEMSFRASIVAGLVDQRINRGCRRATRVARPRSRFRPVPRGSGFAPRNRGCRFLLLRGRRRRRFRRYKPRAANELRRSPCRGGGLAPVGRDCARTF